MAAASSFLFSPTSSSSERGRCHGLTCSLAPRGPTHSSPLLNYIHVYSKRGIGDDGDSGRMSPVRLQAEWL